MAAPEKALLDLLYIRASKNPEDGEERVFSLMEDMYLEELNQQKLQTYLQRFPPHVQHVWDKFQSKSKPVEEQIHGWIPRSEVR